MRFLRAALAGVLPILGVGLGCNALLGLELGEPETGSGGGASSSSTGGGEGGLGTGGSGAATSTSTSSQGGGPGENCLDGLDDDLDGAIDCEDTDCQPDHECVPEVVAPWEGYYRVATEDFPAGAPTPCPDQTTPASYFGTPGGPAQCEACSCGGIEGGCSLPVLNLRFNSASCGASSLSFTPPNTDCQSLPPAATCNLTCGNPQAGFIDESQPLGPPGCPPSGGAANVPETWGVERRACQSQSAGAGCSNGMVCVAKGPAPYDLAACVFQQGEHACPGDWPNTLDAYTDGTDTRSCSACTCDVAGPDCVGEKITVYDDSACGNGGTPPVDIEPSQCVSVQEHIDNSEGSYQATAATLTGMCSPEGGAPTGAVEPSGAVTFCCR